MESRHCEQASYLRSQRGSGFTIRAGGNIKELLERKTKFWFLGLPWWPSVWESACQCRGHGLDPRSGKIARAVWQRGPWPALQWTCTLEPGTCTYWALAPGAGALQWREAIAMRSSCTTIRQELPHSLQLEEARAWRRRPSAAKKYNK